jgi:hypothetical protein
MVDRSGQPVAVNSILAENPLIREISLWPYSVNGMGFFYGESICAGIKQIENSQYKRRNSP